MTRHPPAPTTTAQPPPTWARRAGHVAWIAPVLGFIPLHVPWILGIPMFADPDRFREWYHGRGPGVGEHPVDGFLGLPAGAFYLGLLCVLAGLGGVLALGLIKDWGGSPASAGLDVRVAGGRLVLLPPYQERAGRRAN
ncbi:hypothetical protein AB0B74_21860 [Micromonospora parva]|uniref:hypothetical protein n=1 Tax=Micromonospora parva TaxID=1464048 RepID=UPI0033EDAA80